MAIVYMNVRGGSSGGPSVWAARMHANLRKKGHTVIFDNPAKSDVAMCIISAGGIINKVNRDKTRVMMRLNGIYNDLYNQKFGRRVRPDMVALHNDLKDNIPIADHCVYQSKWSFDRIQEEIIKYNKNYSIIHNGSNPNIFKPLNTRKKDGFTNLLAVGLMRDAYYMKTLISSYQMLKSRGVKVRLLLVGTMDGPCKKIFAASSRDPNIKHLGSIPNGKINNAYNMGDIFLNVRMGCSCNQTTSEAQMAGLPVVTPAWGGDCEMIVDGKTGVIVDGGKWDYDQNYYHNIADGVQKIIVDIDNYKKQSREHAVKNLSIDKMVSEYLKAMKL